MQIFCRLHEKFQQLGSTFVVSPVSDPDQIERAWNFRQRVKHANVRRFVPRPCPSAPAVTQVHVGEHLSVSKHTVVISQAERKIGVSRDAMVRVVKEQGEVSLDTAKLADALDQRGVIPLMHDYELRAVECLFEIELLQIEAIGKELRVRVVKLKQWFRAVFRNQVLNTPGVARLVDTQLMSSS